MIRAGDSMDSIAPFRYCCSLSLRLLVWWSSISSKNTMRLPQGHKIQMPLWSIDKWSTLSFVRLGLPKHYTRKLRERLLADPIQVQLRLYNERYFLSASVLLNLIETCHAKIQAELRPLEDGPTCNGGISTLNSYNCCETKPRRYGEIH